MRPSAVPGNGCLHPNVDRHGHVDRGHVHSGGNRPDTGGYVVTAPLAYNISNANLLLALQALNIFTPWIMTVTGTALAVGPVTITGQIPVLTVDNTNLVGGTIAAAAGTTVSNNNMFVPFDPSSASAGGTVCNRGKCVILEHTVLELGIIPGFTHLATNHPPCVVGGDLFAARVLANGSADSLANGPTWAHLEAAMPLVNWVGDKLT